MSFWKIMGGVGIGVGAVAAAPFTGGGSLLAGATAITALAGVGTVATAVGAGIAGGVVGACLSDADKKKVEEREQEFKLELQKAYDRSKGQEERNEITIALFAIGMATAFADGFVNKEELDNLNQFVFGVAHSHLPNNVKNAIQSLRDNPPSFNTAMCFVKKVQGIANKELFEKVIKIVSMSDGNECDEEKALLESFHKEFCV